MKKSIVSLAFAVVASMSSMAFAQKNIVETAVEANHNTGTTVAELTQPTKVVGTLRRAVRS